MLKRTPFYENHLQLKAKLVEFGGFEMPVQYSGIRNEHHAVRRTVGLFDVSHMGEFLVTGSDALTLLQRITVNDVSKLSPGEAQYSAMCYEDGGIVDDLLVYMLDSDRYMMVVNASNIDKDWEWISSCNTVGVELTDISEKTALIALQGPNSVELLKKLTPVDLDNISYYKFKKGTVAEQPDIIVSYTGYTGEKGFELYMDTNMTDAGHIWDELMDKGKEFGLEPAGLGARDTLRLEKGYLLYGNDITNRTNPIEAGMSWLVKMNKGPFIGREALREKKENGISRKLAGFIMDNERQIPRSGYDICDQDGNKTGFVTSGTQSVTLSKGIGMGYVPVNFATEGKKVYILIRNKQIPATISALPFIK